MTEFEIASAKGVQLTREEELVGYGKVMGEAKDTVVRLAEVYAREVAPEYQPVFVEEKHTLGIPKCDYDLLTVMDLADDLDRIVDLKTGTKSKPQREVDISEQLSFYALIFKGLTKRLPTEVRLETLVDTKTPKRQILSAMRDQKDLEILVERINIMIKRIEVYTVFEFWPPTNPLNWYCDPRYCGFFYSCPFVRH